jgi:hypothetical protein
MAEELEVDLEGLRASLAPEVDRTPREMSL